MKKLEKIISVSLKGFGIEIENNLICYKDMMVKIFHYQIPFQTNFLDTQKLISAAEKTQILKHLLEISKNQFRNKEELVAQT
jgi:hypothetical protein